MMKNYSKFYGYANSKLAVAHFGLALAHKLKQSNKKIDVFLVNPGVSRKSKPRNFLFRVFDSTCAPFNFLFRRLVQILSDRFLVGSSGSTTLLDLFFVKLFFLGLALRYTRRYHVTSTENREACYSSAKNRHLTREVKFLTKTIEKTFGNWRKN